MEIHFDDTATAFAYKSNGDLKKANFIFSAVKNPLICSLATHAVKLGLQIGLPIEGLIRKTVFAHFCAGATITTSRNVIERIGERGVNSILDYSVEGEQTEDGFACTTEEIIRTIKNAAQQKHIPFSVFKMTGIASAALLEKIQNGDILSEREEFEFDRLKTRVETICHAAYQQNIPVLIDAEESWIQDAIDYVVYEMMAKFNKEKAIVFNTYQLYRTEALTNLALAIKDATYRGYYFGAKLVRGAYMEKERARAFSLGYPSPVHADQNATNRDFDLALKFCVEHIDRVSLICGSHNEISSNYLVHLMELRKLKNNDPRIWFSQLYGMSDTISFNLAKNGYNVAKYLPYGPVKSVMPYLLRRASENTSVAGQSGRELKMIRLEISRRKARAHNVGIVD